MSFIRSSTRVREGFDMEFMKLRQTLGLSVIVSSCHIITLVYCAR